MFLQCDFLWILGDDWGPQGGATRRLARLGLLPGHVFIDIFANNKIFAAEGLHFHDFRFPILLKELTFSQSFP